jgi:hypothetical protein
MNTETSATHSWPDPLEPPESAAVARQLASFWTTLGQLPALLTKDEQLLAAELAQELRRIMIDLMLALNGIQRPAGTRDLNRYLSANQRTALERTLTAPVPASESWVAQAVALVVIYRWYAPQLTKRFGLTYPQAAEDRAWEALRAGIYDWPAAITTDPVADPTR